MMASIDVAIAVAIAVAVIVAVTLLPEASLALSGATTGGP